MVLETYYKKVAAYQKKSLRVIAKQQKKTFLFMSVAVAVVVACVYIGLELFDFTWYRVFKIKLKYWFLNYF